MDLHPSPRKWSASLAVIALLAALLPFAALTPATAAPVPGVAAAIQFDGTNDYVTFGDPASLDLTTFTIETWFNRTGNGTSNTTGTGGITNMIPLVTHGAPQGDGSNIDANWIFGINDTSDVLAADFEDMATGGNHPVSGTTVIANNTWHHAAATYDGTTWRLYLDGNLEVTEAENATPRSDTIQRAGLGTMLPSGTGTPVGFFAGALDEPRVWNRALSANEIQTGMSQQLTSGSGLVARWGLNEGTDATAADSIGTATGTLTNGPTWVDGGPFTPFAGCQPAVACGIRFDGTNDYVTFGDPGSLDLAQFTIETWFNRTGNGTSNTTGTGGILNAIPLVTHGAPQAEGSNVDADWILAINDATDVIAADFEDTATGANHPVSGTTLITNNVWHHAAATYDGTTWRLYLDGNLEATLAVNQTPRSDTIQRAALGTMLPSGTGTPVGFFAGSLDEPRVWNRALSANEIQTGMSQQLTSGSGLVARWGLNEGTATTAADSIGTATGTLTNGPVWTGGSPFTPFAGAIDIQLNAPTDGANGVDTSPTLDVTVTDPDSQPLDVTFFARPYKSGNFAQIGTDNGVASGGNATFQWPNIGQGQTFEWYVTVDNGPTSITGPTWTFHTAATDPIFVGAGDIADCGRTQDTATGDIISGIDGTVWTTGDNVYPWGSAANYTNCYDTTGWGGSTVARTRAVPGNHDWGTGQVPSGQETLANYFNYFGSNSQGSSGESYYSYDIPSSNWHVVNLDSECQLVPGGCGAGSPQDQWLEADLAANSSKNVIALWHKPRYSSGVTTYTTMQPLWDDLYDAGVDLLLLGHDHVYERTAPMKSGATIGSDPVADPTYGIRQFTVGTGGAALQGGFSPIPPSEVRRDDTYGVLKLTLHATTYDWQFLPIAGSTFTDSGSGSVHGAPAEPNASPNAPVVNDPADAAGGVSTSPMLDVHVTDPDADAMTVRFYGRPHASGVYELIDTVNNVPSGTDVTTQWPGLDDGHGYQWYVTLDDGTNPLTTGSTWTFTTQANPDPVFVGVGDIASCASQAQLDAAANTAEIISAIQGSIFTTGDNVYPNGTAAEFTNCYDPSWGAPGIKSRTRPVPGNHDWGTGAQENLNDYFAYFGAAANSGGASYYSYDIAGSNWHVVNLDSECQLVPGGCGVGSPQETWLKADLAANSTENVIAVWHKPRFSSGQTNYAAVQPFVDALYAAGADLVLVGHDHVYERQQPLDPSGNADATHGISYFTVGTGGESHHGTGTLRPTSQALNNDTYGIMKFTLHANSYDWEFFPEAGETFTDSGTRSVHDAPVTSQPNRNDFTGDGKADILLRNSSSGAMYLWQMNGSTLVSSNFVGSESTAYETAGVADFTGDGKADILLRNSSSGAMYLWQMNGSTLVSSNFVGSESTAYETAGVADFTGDGKADILLRNSSSGAMYLWQMNGSTLVSSNFVGSESTAYETAGVADFTGDGKADILLRNSSSGAMYLWQMNGSTLVSSNFVGSESTAYETAGVADFTGDGKADILLRNSSSGAMYLWQMNGSTLVSSNFVGSESTAYETAGVADFTGDGKADILLRNSSSGAMYLWQMNGSTLVSSNFVGSEDPVFEVANFLR